MRFKLSQPKAHFLLSPIIQMHKPYYFFKRPNLFLFLEVFILRQFKIVFHYILV